MKFTIKFLVLVVGMLLANTASAETPREQFEQMVEQLQKTPTDDALREKIIKLARKMKPAPAVPDTAVAFEGRAQFAFKSAKSENDFLAAAQEYEKAVATAPWVPGYYADLCTIYEKAGKFEDAKRHCGFYLIGLFDPAQTTDVKRRIAGLEFGIEKANSSEIRAAKEKRDLVGNWKIFVNGRPQRVGDKHDNGEGSDVMSDMHYRFEMRGDEIVVYSVTDADPAFLHTSWCRRNGGGFDCKGDETLFGRFVVDKNMIRGKLQRDEKSTDHSNTDLSGTYSDSEIRWVYAAYIYTYRETLRKQD